MADDWEREVRHAIAEHHKMLAGFAVIAVIAIAAAVLVAGSTQPPAVSAVSQPSGGTESFQGQPPALVYNASANESNCGTAFINIGTPYNTITRTCFWAGGPLNISLKDGDLNAMLIVTNGAGDTSIYYGYACGTFFNNANYAPDTYTIILSTQDGYKLGCGGSAGFSAKAG